MKVHHVSDFAALRRAAYPPVAEQLDIIFHGGLDAWRAQIAAVKARFPKPEDETHGVV